MRRNLWPWKKRIECSGSAGALKPDCHHQICRSDSRAGLHVSSSHTQLHVCNVIVSAPGPGDVCDVPALCLHRGTAPSPYPGNLCLACQHSIFVGALQPDVASENQRRRAMQRFTSRCHVYDICQALMASMERPRPGLPPHY